MEKFDCSHLLSSNRMQKVMRIAVNVAAIVLPVLVEALQVYGVLDSAPHKPKSTKTKKKADAPAPAAA